jgi:hypothetical protein
MTRQPGTAFVGTGVELDKGLLFYKGLFGYYPAEGGKSELKALWRTDGDIEATWSDLNPSITYRVPLSDARMQEVLDALAKWKSSDPGYSLLALKGNNCSVLAKDVAQSVGPKYLRPTRDYISGRLHRKTERRQHVRDGSAWKGCVN